MGMAFWYKDSGPWWDKRSMKPNDGISLEEQQKLLDLHGIDYGLSKLALVSGTPNVKLPVDGRFLVMTPYAVQVWRFLHLSFILLILYDIRTGFCIQ